MLNHVMYFFIIIIIYENIIFLFLRDLAIYNLK